MCIQQTTPPQRQLRSKGLPAIAEAHSAAINASVAPVRLLVVVFNATDGVLVHVLHVLESTLAVVTAATKVGKAVIRLITLT